jgi:hypothetical protein
MPQRIQLPVQRDAPSSRGMPRESPDAREDLPKERRCQVAVPQLSGAHDLSAPESK